MKTFAIGDIHGAHKALLQCIQRSGIDKENDRLIFVGDMVDGWPLVPECVDTLLEFKNLIIIRGNHDQWFMNWANTGVIAPAWYQQGGQATLLKYEFDRDLTKKHMDEYFNKSMIYYVDEERNFAFMHGGYDWHIPLCENDKDTIMWDRHMYQTAFYWETSNSVNKENNKFKEFDTIFVGHTTTQWKINWKHEPSTLPSFFSNLVNLDTGAGWSGRLTIMNVDDLMYWQSDPVQELYPDITNSRK